MKRYFDRGAVRSDIKEGDWVLLKKQPRSNTLSSHYECPLIVAKRRGTNVHLRNHESGTIRVVHVNKCKKMPHFGEECACDGTYGWSENEWEKVSEENEEEKLLEHQERFDEREENPEVVIETNLESNEPLTTRRSNRSRKRPFWCTDDYVYKIVSNPRVALAYR